MDNRAAVASVSSVDHLDQLLSTEFQNTQFAYELIDEFLGHSTFSKPFCLRLLSLARNGRDVSWESRRLATLMLEHQALLIPPGNLADFDSLLTALQLKNYGTDQPLNAAILKEGYSSTDFRLFVPEFCHRLARLDRVHRNIKGQQTSRMALRDFVEASLSECKLALARYLFTPREVVDRIFSQVQVTRGLPDVGLGPTDIGVDKDASLPPYEAEILKLLLAAQYVYWVAENTSEKINSLLEYPVTTVALVVKPPGSDCEFQFKRAGRKGRNLLNVVYARNGFTVPPSHRLDGGCMQYLLRFESRAADRISAMYRLVHKSEPPVPTYIYRRTIDAVPIRNVAIPQVRYFTDPGVFGEGYSGMRRAMSECMVAFKREGYPELPALQGELGLTARFIGIVAPSQAVLTGTTSFRLNKVATYLTSEGPKSYFGEGLRRYCTVSEARFFADTVLEEVLGVYSPPDIQYRDQQQYVDAALSVPANRARADRNYLSILEQTAKFWGTLLAVRGNSRGESFCGRNAGIRSVWEDGDWKIKITFMDHDALVLPDPYTEEFGAYHALIRLRTDERYIWETENPHLFPTSIAGYLRTIYRIQDDKENEGRSLFIQVVTEAYKTTQRALLTDPHLRALFNPIFLSRLLIFDMLVPGMLHAQRESPSWQSWKERMTQTLLAHGYRDNSFESYAEIIEFHRPFLERHFYLFDSNSEH
jgi:hypothetical protein